jgi:adenylate kinase
VKNINDAEYFLDRKLVVLITGTPCTGKTTLARLLAPKLDAIHINLTSFASTHQLILSTDSIRQSKIINQSLMKRKLGEVIQNTRKSIIVDGHYAPDVVPPKMITHIFVLRRDPLELKTIMEQCGFNAQKIRENLAAEILDVCLNNALTVSKNKVCELNISTMPVNEVVYKITEALRTPKKCQFGIVDWLTRLEDLGVLDEFLKE